MPEDEIRPSDTCCGGCDFYLGLEECVLPPGCCVLVDTACDLDFEVSDAMTEREEHYD